MISTPKTFPTLVVIAAFTVGILCATGFRLLMVLERVQPSFVRPVWYFSVIGYTFFFAYRYFVSVKRRRIIQENNLLAKMASHEKITEDDRELLSYILLSLLKSKESINYFFIFMMSLAAILLDIIISWK